jgi:hypothetical protein
MALTLTERDRSTYAERNRSPLNDILDHGVFKWERFRISDLSLNPRYGCKGPGAAQWLEKSGLKIPSQPNCAEKSADGGWVLRLGLTEFLIEGPQATIDKLNGTPREYGLYPVLRQDACFLLSGAKVNDVFVQSCNINFLDIKGENNPVIMTSMAGVGVTVLPIKEGASTSYQIWCDGTFGLYLLQAFTEIASKSVY